MFDYFQTKLIFFPNFLIIIGMTRKVKTFFHVLTGSIVPQTPYYAKILKTRMLFSLSYILATLALASILAMAVIFIRISNESPLNAQSCIRSSFERIPDNYVLHIKGGRMSSNHAMPLFVWLNCNDKTHLLAVVDERATGKDVYAYGASLLLTGSELVVRYKNYTTSFPLTKYVQDLYLEKNDLIAYAQKAIDIVKLYVPFFTVSLLFATPFILYALNCLYIVLSSILVKIFYYLTGKRYTLRKIFQVGLHSCSLPLMSSILFIIFPVNLTNTLLLYFSLVFIFQLVAVYEAHYVIVPEHHSRPLHK